MADTENHVSIGQPSRRHPIKTAGLNRVIIKAISKLKARGFPSNPSAEERVNRRLRPSLRTLERQFDWGFTPSLYFSLRFHLARLTRLAGGDTRILNTIFKAEKLHRSTNVGRKRSTEINHVRKKKKKYLSFFGFSTTCWESTYVFISVGLNRVANKDLPPVSGIGL